MTADAVPLVIAHRGASRDCPENTHAAFEEALRQGCDGIELDVQLSRDGVPVVYHDRTLIRAGGGRKRVHRLNAAELMALDPGARVDSRFREQHIPALSEVLDRYAGRTRLWIEIKTREGEAALERYRQLARAVVTMILERQVERNVMLLSFDERVLDACRESAPEVPRVLNLNAPRSIHRALERSLDVLHGLSVNVRSLTRDFAAEYGRTGKPLFVYTCNTARQAEQALSAGATGVMSDRPGWLSRLVGSGVGHDAT